MVEPKHDLSLARPASLRDVSAASPAKAADPAIAERGARFQALLEELDSRAREVAKSASEPQSAQSLPTAVENARASLDHALQLGESLLEAFRQSTAQSAAGETNRA
ncbi:MAG TPA: hypothetical protein VM509_12500 [Planctomycetota bacterium]|nr:hypothetical protein [Planctomycetota bacterium]